MTKRLLLGAGDGDYEYYVERTPEATKYYEKEWYGNEYNEISKKEMKEIVKSDLEEYGYVVKQPFAPLQRDEAQADYIRLVENAPELLPNSIALKESISPDSLRMENPPDYCPPGYEYVKGYRKGKYDIVKGYCRKKSR